MLLFGGASYATNEAQSSSGIEVASTATTGHQMTAEITRVTSSGTHITSTVSVQGTWAVDKLEKGQSFTIEAGPYLKWSSNFPFTLDTGERIGECVTSEGTLTCTVTEEVPASMVDKTNVTGHWWADSKIQEASVGRTVTELTLNGKTTSVTFGDSNGDGTCDRDCGPVHYSYVTADNFKAGWLNADGSTSWMISWIASPGTEYTVHDEYTQLSTSVSCATSATWDPATTTKLTADRVDDNTIKMIAPANAQVCVTYTPIPMRAAAGAKSVTNIATVNGVRYENTVKVEVAGGTDGDGTAPSPQPTPTPAPTPSPVPTPTPTPTPTPEPSPSTTPEPSPSAPSPAPSPSTTPSTPTPSPSATPTPSPSTTPSVMPTPTPSPTTTPSAPTPSTTPSVTPTPSPSTTPTRRPPLPTPVIERYKEPTPSATPTPAPQHKKLAVTGTSGDVATSAVALVALGGFLIWARRRQTAHPED